MAPCVNARSPATSTTLIVTGVFGNAGTCAVAVVAVEPITSTPTQKCVIRRANVLRDGRTTLACASAESVLKTPPSPSDGFHCHHQSSFPHAGIHFRVGTILGPRFRGDDISVSNRALSCGGALLDGYVT